MRSQMEKKVAALAARQEARQAQQEKQKQIREEQAKERLAMRRAAQILAKVALVKGRLQLALEADRSATTPAPANISKPAAKSLKDLERLMAKADSATKVADYSDDLSNEAVSEMLSTAMKHEAALKDITKSLQRLCG